MNDEQTHQAKLLSKTDFASVRIRNNGEKTSKMLDLSMQMRGLHER
ncbi:MAG: hypothetical protein Q4B32_02710 [Clostridia bacterium]|nr:hypothetical protein [Clostridia bacterium]